MGGETSENTKNTKNGGDFGDKKDAGTLHFPPAKGRHMRSNNMQFDVINSCCRSSTGDFNDDVEESGEQD